ncbi:uncharacterized protein [Hyperolius riggenbachi]|uniref:uncharacterized protein isoform X2 n=1 Tax=Hyperolius riggenbachi TaxID=752182 RepID=UPI0035A28740
MMQYLMRQQPYPFHQLSMNQTEKLRQLKNSGWKAQPFGLTKRVDILEKKPLTESDENVWLRPWSPWYRVVGVCWRKYTWTKDDPR